MRQYSRTPRSRIRNSVPANAAAAAAVAGAAVGAGWVEKFWTGDLPFPGIVRKRDGRRKRKIVQKN